MTKEELLEILAQCHTGDCESDHVKADKALLEFINDDDISDAFFSIEEWYA